METSFATARLDPRLTPYVRRIMGARLVGAAPTRALELPLAGTAVIVELRRSWCVAADPDASLERFGSFAGGLSLLPAVSEHTGEYELVELVLTPVGTAAILGVPAAALAGRVVALDALLGPEAARLEERLAGLAGWEARFAATVRWARARITRADEDVRPDVAWALGRLDATGGRLPIAAVQAELRCSRRHLSARFAADVGTTPKAYAQLVRFTRAAERLRAGEAPASVAATCGYADQAHLTRHVRRFGATTPAALRRAGAPVTDVQDAPFAAA